MIHILSIFGTRPEAIKMAPVVRELDKYRDRIRSLVCVTAQHREMLNQVLETFDIRPDVDLDLMQPNQTLPDLTARSLAEVSRVLEELRPDLVLVQGDTTTVMAVALAAFYQRIPVGHIEAGLRTGNLYGPFPEEMNRRIADVLTTFCFAPTVTAADALRREGVSEERIFITGNTVIDALHWIVRQPPSAQTLELFRRLGLRIEGSQSMTDISKPGSEHLSAQTDASVPNAKSLILVTAHRRESFGAPLEEICLGLQELAQRNPEVVIVYPVHLNPNVYDPVHRILDSEERIHLIAPLPYLSFIHLMNRAHIILTDSGGIQEEAPALGKPVLVLRRETERPEAVEAGTVKLVGPAAGRIVAETERLLHNEAAYREMANAVSPYGDGHAAERIVRIILEQMADG